MAANPENTSQPKDSCVWTKQGGHGNYVLKPGDCLDSVAFETGFFGETLWNDPQNAELKQLRKSYNLLLPGDSLAIPPLRERSESCSEKSRHRFRRKGIPTKLELRLLDDEGEPMANQHYLLDIDGRVTEGDLDSDGRLEIQLPPAAQCGKLVLTEFSEEYELGFGELDPQDSVTGFQARLKNLGYYLGKIDGNLGDETREAIRELQKDYGLQVTGEVDDVTQMKLEEGHES